ncbi:MULTISPECIES: TMEM175 family protein [unclassified Leifsonia]|uniref:TMEM175 family protein n=1 Tax=unclassified Leifsonia TaxID=2663824 RepID=UPI000B134CD0|nr:MULTISPECIES: TMEM175 family protein [unclassified Leifsonia]
MADRTERVARRTGAESRYRRLLMQGTNTERLVFFSDAVMAIAMTLLVLEIHIPEVADDEIGRVLVENVGVFGAYALSFTIIGVNWITHHRKFSVIDRYDTPLLRINLVFLFLIAVLPVATIALTMYQLPVVVALYALDVAGISLVQLWIWVYAWRHDLIRDDVDFDVYALSVRNQFPVPAIFLVSIPVALFVDPVWAMYFWILIVPLAVITARLPLPNQRRSERLVAIRVEARTAENERIEEEDLAIAAVEAAAALSRSRD